MPSSCCHTVADATGVVPVLSPGTIPDWPRAYGEPPVRAHVRATAEDFRVDEILGFAPDGEGEHLLVQVQKRNRNTDQVARELARLAGIRARDVSYCGLKDRVAVTTQWFSLWLPGRPDPHWAALETEDLKVLTQGRHRRKLPRGALQANRFALVLRDVHGDKDALHQRLMTMSHTGVPNYFGVQRFGRERDNLAKARAMFGGRRVKDRHLRGLYLSAARAALFNRVLAARVTAANWHQLIAGEACMLTGSRSFFVAGEIDTALRARLAAQDISPSAPLWGRGEPPCEGPARELEWAALAGEECFRLGLEQAGLKQERRATRLIIEEFRWRWLAGAPDLELGFVLPAGSYATAVLRELVAAP